MLQRLEIADTFQAVALQVELLDGTKWLEVVDFLNAFVVKDHPFQIHDSFSNVGCCHPGDYIFPKRFRRNELH